MWIHRRRPEDAVRERDALRRSDEERNALARLRGHISPVIDMCNSYIEQFPEDRPASTLQIRPGKVANRLAPLREAWLDEEPRIKSERVREAYDDVGVDRLLRKIPRTEAPTTDYEGLVPTIKGLRASLQGLNREIGDALR